MAYNEPDEPRKILAALAFSAIGAIALLVTFSAGVSYSNAGHLERCRSGEKFYDLNPEGDVPYRCEAVIDYPTQGTQ